ncbi:unnamed protein product [Pieris macdunnoughi]|uniref:Ommochrome-binding protein-like n=1 Tax=Pieris macdunnoughi TaxID=345717 RepID=A0A821RCR2_9NEOP|nr:unnamed protein product [Pieris macdunnoughi]
MLLLLLFVALNSAEKNNVNETVTCDGVVFHQVYYDRQILIKNLGRPYNLVMHKYSRTLFFSQTVQNKRGVDFEIKACDLSIIKDDKNPECYVIKGVPGGYAIAYDAGNDDLYFGGHDGIYKYDFQTKQAKFFSEKGKSIWGLFIRRNFYFIEYPSQKLYVYYNDRFVKVAEAVNIEVDIFFKSKMGEVYFANKTALYKVEKLTKHAIVLSDNIIVRQIADDTFGDVYICASDGVYLEDKPYHRVKKVADIERAFGLTFDERDNVMYSDEETISRLLPSNKSKTCWYDYTVGGEDDGLRDYVIS